MSPFKTVSAGIAVIALGAGLAAASATPAAAADPGPVIAGVIGGAALGALAAGAAGRPHYAPPVYAPAYRPAPVYYDDDDQVEIYRPRCHIARQEVFDRWGDFAGYRRVRVCR